MTPLLFRIGLLAIGLQLLGLLALSYFTYHRFTLGIDFSIYDQAATEISRGMLNPHTTVHGYPYTAPSYPFINNHAELILWPLSLFLLVFRSSLVLLVVQDVAIVGSGLVAFLWIGKGAVARNVSRRSAAVALSIVLLFILINPLAYATATLDFHVEPIATFFAVYAAFDLWSGRHRRALAWLGLCLLCGDVGGLYVVGIGISAALASSTARRLGIAVGLCGIAWVALISAWHANQGSNLQTGYAYLAGRTVLPGGIGGVLPVIEGVITHPSRLFDTLNSRRHLIVTSMIPSGVFGIFTPWGLGVPLIVLLSSSLQLSPVFIGEPFQQFAVFPFLLFGAVSLISRLIPTSVPRVVPTTLWKGSQALRRGLAVLAIVSTALGVLAFAYSRFPVAAKTTAIGGYVTANEASVLSNVLSQTPMQAEVIASLPISGRFSGRTNVYLYMSTTAPIPITESQVVLVMDLAHPLQFVQAAQQELAARFVIRTFHAHTLARTSDVWALEWNTSNTQRSVVLP